MGITQAELETLYKRSGHVSPNESVKVKISKLGNIRKMVDGISFDSSSEASAYQVLKLWKCAGHIRDLRMQPTFTLQERFKDESGRTVNAIHYSADFSFYDESQRRVRTVDIKGHITQAFTRTMKLMKNKYPDIEVEIWDKAKVRELSRC